jgi:hypothetical protein
LDPLDAVRRAEHILDHALLCPVEMLVLVGNGEAWKSSAWIKSSDRS